MLAVHITPIQNLEGNLTRGGLWSDSHFAVSSGKPAVVTDEAIKARRARYRVPGTTRTLADYVPFFFFQRNSMTFRLCRENDPSELLFVVINTDDYLGDEDIRFTDRHALSTSTFHEYLANVDSVLRRDLLRTSWFGDDLMGKRLQAEFLVWMTARKRRFRGFAVASEAAACSVTALVPPTAVRVRSEWFFC